MPCAAAESIISGTGRSLLSGGRKEVSQGMSDALQPSGQDPSQIEWEFCLDDIFEAAKFAAASAGTGDTATNSDAEARRHEVATDRRKRRRALISAPVRVRGINVTDAVVDEISTTIDVSRGGILFVSSSPNYSARHGSRGRISVQLGTRYFSGGAAGPHRARFRDAGWAIRSGNRAR